jgi:hypothetical protein
MRIAEPLRARCESVLIGLGIGLLFFAVPHAMTGDGQIRYAALADLIERGRLSNVQYSLVGPLFSTPLYYLGKLALGPEWWCARFNTLLLAGGLIATILLLGRSVEGRTLRAFALVILAASMFPNHVRDYFGEVFTAVFVLVGLAAIASRRSAFGWTTMVIGVANTPATIVGLLLVALKRAWDTKRARYLIAVAATAALILLENWIRRGHPLATGYGNNAGFPTVMPYSGQPGFSYPLLFGLLSIVLSFGKGLLFFAPGLLLIRQNEDQPTSKPLLELVHYSMWFLAGLILVYAKWWAWYGGWFWGPRFFLVASIPASLAIALRLRSPERLSAQAAAGLLVVLMLSVWVGVNGAIFDRDNLAVCVENSYALEFLCWYTPEFSVLWRPFVVSNRLASGQWLYPALCTVVFLWLSAPLMKTLAARATAITAIELRQLKRWRY